MLGIERVYDASGGVLYLSNVVQSTSIAWTPPSDYLVPHLIEPAICLTPVAGRSLSLVEHQIFQRALLRNAKIVQRLPVHSR